MGLYNDRHVTMARLDPANPDHEVDTELEDAPRGSKIVDAAYSTATNVVYMKLEVGKDKYRVYRTDANYDTRRVYMQADNIGRIAVFYDKDEFFYDNASKGDIYAFDGIESSWRAINPSGRWRLVGVDMHDNIYIAHVNSDDQVLSVSKGKLGKGFDKVFTYKTPTDLDDVTMEAVKEIEENGSDQVTTDDDKDSSSKKSE